MSKKVLGVWGLIVVFLITLSVVGFGKNLLVPEDFSSIQAAVDAAKSGDSILLSSGNYAENVVISGKKNLTITSRDLREFTVVEGQFKIKGSTNITLSNFTVTGPGYGIAVRGESIGLTFDELAILQNALGGINFSGKGTKYYHVNITNCKISSNGGDGITLQGQGNNIIIQGNSITGNGTYTPPAQMAGGAGGVQPKGAKAVGVRVGLNKKDVAGGAGEFGAATDVLQILINNNTISGNAFAAIHSVSPIPVE
ncbi:MAG: right-handed parallel beta-helix repeat-containing protein [Candidatus Bipolaricaulia bacterium]